MNNPRCSLTSNFISQKEGKSKQFWTDWVEKWIRKEHLSLDATMREFCHNMNRWIWNRNDIVTTLIRIDNEVARSLVFRTKTRFRFPARTLLPFLWIFQLSLVWTNFWPFPTNCLEVERGGGWAELEVWKEENASLWRFHTREGLFVWDGLSVGYFASDRKNVFILKYDTFFA